MHYVGGHDEAELKLPLKFPVELRKPERFDADDLSTWPRIAGRLEYLEGKLLYMPPCGDEQGRTAADAAFLLRAWSKTHVEFVVLTNEAGMKLGAETRGADGAVWLRASLGQARRAFARVPPVLAVEVEGEDEGEESLRKKARWYLDHGVAVVWLVMTSTREVLVVSAKGDSRHKLGDTLPEASALPGLHPKVDEFFEQLEA
jgi:Uma2 family endonuclease